MQGLIRGKVILESHQTEWEEEAERVILLLRSLLGKDALDIQHVGSTAIKEIPAKPIIDLAVAADSFDSILSHNDSLADHGIVYRGQEHGNQLLYVCGEMEADTRTHHIHVVLNGSESWENYLNFRDYLNCHRPDAEVYAHLKQHLAERYPNDRAAYTAGKQKLINELLKKAAVWRKTARGGKL